VCERTAALKAGWLEHQRVNAPAGHLIIRCPDHITAHALRLAGLPQKTTSRRVEENLDRGLYTEYGDGYIAAVHESEDENAGETHYVLQYHRDGFPAHDADAFETIPALIQSMRKVEPDLRKWKLAEAE